MSITNIVKELRENDEDFELYPTTKEMLVSVFADIGQNPDFDFSVLDIGAGTCNFKKFFRESYGYDLKKYYVIEKSKLLINMMDKDTVVLGMDFWQNTLVDKDVKCIFCNPPYSEYSKWVCRILETTTARDIYVVIPQRWKDDEDIKKALDGTLYEASVLMSSDFLDAERKARAKVDVVAFKRHYRYSERDAFGKWFDDTFPEAEKVIKDDLTDKTKIKNQLSTGKDKIQILCQLYDNEMSKLCENFSLITKMDSELLESINVSRKAVREALKIRIENLKKVYWEIAFESLESITDRLTRKSRNKMLDNFKILKSVDFNHENVYNMVIWVCKNAQSYYNEQLTEFYKQISSPENVIPYKSNKNTFSSDRWRWNQENHTNYVLDYRIILSNRTFGSESWRSVWECDRQCVEDLATIANNLGFYITDIDYPDIGEPGKYYTYNGEIVMEVKIFKNGNAHIKMSQKFSRAFNVEAARLLGWIRNKTEIKEEFPDELAIDAEQYFGTNKTIDATYRNLLTN